MAVGGSVLKRERINPTGNWKGKKENFKTRPKEKTRETLKEPEMGI